MGLAILLVWGCWLTRWGWCKQASLVVGLAILLALLNFLLMAPWAAWVAGVGTGLTMLLVLFLFSFLLLAVWVVWVVGAGVGLAILLALIALLLKLLVGSVWVG